MRERREKRSGNEKAKQSIRMDLGSLERNFGKKRQRS